MDNVTRECVTHVFFYGDKQIYMRLRLLKEYPEDLLTSDVIKKNGIYNLQNTSKVSRELSSYIENIEKTGKKDKKTIRTGIRVIAAVAAIPVIFAALGAFGYYISTTYAVRTPTNIKESVVTTVESKDKSYFENIEYMGWTKSDATVDIKAAGWSVTYEDVYSWKIKKGCVVTDVYSDDNKTITLGISQGAPEPDRVKITNVKISVNVAEIILNKGSSVDLVVSVSGDYPNTCYLNCQTFTDLEKKWGVWVDDDPIKITITANSVDEGYVRFMMVDGETKECIGYTDIFVTVQ